MVFLNYAVIEPLLIPDPCYYHSHNSNFMIDIFYNSSSASNGHPEPNIFNFIFTLCIGILLAKLTINCMANRQD